MVSPLDTLRHYVSGSILRGEAEAVTEQRACTLGVGCDEAGACYADYHGDPSQCGRLLGSPEPAPVEEEPAKSL